MNKLKKFFIEYREAIALGFILGGVIDVVLVFPFLLVPKNWDFMAFANGIISFIVVMAGVFMIRKPKDDTKIHR